MLFSSWVSGARLTTELHLLCITLRCQPRSEHHWDCVEQLEETGKAGPTSLHQFLRVLQVRGWCSLVCFLWLLFKSHNDDLPNAKSAELWDSTVAGLTSQRRKFSAYRIVKGDLTVGLPSSARSHMPSPTAWLPVQGKFTLLLHPWPLFVCLGYQKISEDRISLDRLIQCPDPKGLVLQK